MPAKAKTTASKRPAVKKKSSSSRNNRKIVVGIEYIHNQLFTQAHAEEQLWGDDRERIPVARYSLLPQVDKETSTPKIKRTNLSAGQEKTLFLQYNYSKYRLIQLLEARKAGKSASKRHMALWRRRIRQVREKLVHANLPLVPSMAQKSNVSNVEFTELMSEGYMAILRSVEKFDVAKGFKFSTYACRAILASFRRSSSKNQTYRKHVPVQFDMPIEQSDFTERRHHDQRESAVEAVRQVLEANLADLDDIEVSIIQQRFPLLAGEKPRTLAQVGRAVGLSNERVRQIEKNSLSKIRDAIESQLVA